MDKLTMNCSQLLEKFGSITIEKIPNEHYSDPRRGYDRKGFWMQEDVGDLEYSKGKFIVTNYPWKSRKIFKCSVVYENPYDENLGDEECELVKRELSIGDKGFTVLGCEPGSAPRPFIVVGIEGGKLSVIYPYVYILELKGNDVFLKIGNDCIQHIIEPLYNSKNYYVDVKNLGLELMESQVQNYIVYTYDFEGNVDPYVSFNIGSFGNYGLPSKGKIEYPCF